MDIEASITEIERRARDAYESGRSIESCPYPAESSAAYIWKLHFDLQGLSERRAEILSRYPAKSVSAPTSKCRKTRNKNFELHQ